MSFLRKTVNLNVDLEVKSDLQPYCNQYPVDVQVSYLKKKPKKILRQYFTGFVNVFFNTTRYLKLNKTKSVLVYDVSERKTINLNILTSQTKTSSNTIERYKVTRFERYGTCFVSYSIDFKSFKTLGYRKHVESTLVHDGKTGRVRVVASTYVTYLISNLEEQVKYGVNFLGGDYLQDSSIEVQVPFKYKVAIAKLPKLKFTIVNNTAPECFDIRNGIIYYHAKYKNRVDKLELLINGKTITFIARVIDSPVLWCK